MAEVSGPWAEPFNTFSENEWRDLFRALPDGHLPLGTARGLSFTRSGSNREITIGSGFAIVQGTLYENTANKIIDVPVPGSNTRIDFIALRRDPTQSLLADRIKLVLIQGNAASSPVAPALTQNPDGIWEVPLAIIGPYGTGVISAAPFAEIGPVFSRRSFVNLGTAYTSPAQVPGLSGRLRDELFDINGQVWQFTDAGVWVLKSAPQPVEGEAPNTINATSTSYSNLATVCAATFVAPLSGKVKISIAGHINPTTTNTIRMSFEVRLGTSSGGTLVYGPLDRDGLMFKGTSEINWGGSGPIKLVTGLTPGTTYRAWHKTLVGGGTQQVLARKILVDPVV
jgi:hypothetical protein